MDPVKLNELMKLFPKIQILNWGTSNFAVPVILYPFREPFMHAFGYILRIGYDYACNWSGKEGKPRNYAKELHAVVSCVLGKLT